VRESEPKWVSYWKVNKKKEKMQTIWIREIWRIGFVWERDRDRVCVFVRMRVRVQTKFEKINRRTSNT